MATTDPSIVAEILSRLESIGAEYAVLHHEDEVAAGRITSDVDLVLKGEIGRLLVTLAEKLSEATDIRLVLGWNYDRCAVSSFWLRSSGAGGAQVDIVSDPDGVGRYGVSSDFLVNRAIGGVKWRSVLPSDQWWYEAVKLWRKGRSVKLEEHRDNKIDRWPPEGLFSERGMRWALRALDGRPRPSQIRTRLADLATARAVRRVLLPEGAVVSLPSTMSMVELRDVQELFVDVLVGAHTAESKAERILVPFLRRRPVLILMRGRSRFVSPDVDLSTLEKSSICPKVVLDGLQVLQLDRLRTRSGLRGFQ